MTLLSFQEGDVITLKKPHACGGNAWIILRLGAELKLSCQSCGHVIWLKRADFNRQVRKMKKEDGSFVSVLHQS